jgi:hypothetical protein
MTLFVYMFNLLKEYNVYHFNKNETQKLGKLFMNIFKLIKYKTLKFFLL